MIELKRLRYFEYSLISLLVIAIALTIVMGLKAERLLSDVNTTFTNYAQGVEEREKSLEQLFPVIQNYIGNVALAREAKNEHWNQAETDQHLPVNHRSAITALATLEDNWLSQHRQDLVTLSTSYQHVESLAETALITRVFLIFVTGVSIWFIYRLTVEIKRRQEHESRLYLSEAAIEASSNGISVVDDEGKIIFVNPAFEKITGFSTEEVIGQNPKILSSGRHDLAFYQQMWDKIKKEGRWTGEVWNRHKNGELYLEGLEIIKFPQRLFNNGQYLSIFSDITLRKKEENLNAFHATHDPLTKLPNRHVLLDRLYNVLLNCSRTKSSAALLFIDLDKFKEINDSLGHLIGDQVLIGVSQRIMKAIRKTDTVCRYGGDEFIVILPGIHSDHDWQRLIDDLSTKLRKPYLVDGYTLELSASIGAAVHLHSDSVDAEQLIRKADEAMYVAKSTGNNSYCLAS